MIFPRAQRYFAVVLVRSAWSPFADEMAPARALPAPQSTEGAWGKSFSPTSFLSTHAMPASSRVRSLALTMASAQSLPSTSARPLNQWIPRRVFCRSTSEVEPVARAHRAAEPALVDAHEVDEIALAFPALPGDDQCRRGLRHGLDDEHARHDGVVREVALKESRSLTVTHLTPVARSGGSMAVSRSISSIG